MMATPDASKPTISRRTFLRGAVVAGAGAAVGFAAARGSDEGTVWQIDPSRCIACDKCATECVLNPSAAKAVHAFARCGYCRLCTGFFVPDPPRLDEGAENQLCPVNAIQRRFVEDPYYQYTIDEKLCIGCGKCVQGCRTFGNGSLFLQIRHDVCVNCNQCRIATHCPTQAIRRVPASEPYLLIGTPEFVRLESEGPTT